MSLLYPWFFAASCALAAGIVAIHFISHRLREPEPFPTLRFVPERDVQATQMHLRLADWRLLLLRVLIALLLGLALAQPLWVRAGSEAHVVLIDGSAAPERDAAWLEAARAAAEGADAVLVYDTAAREIAPGNLDSVLAAEPAAPVGDLSAALVEAVRRQTALRNRAETVRLTILSPFPAASFDAATVRIRALWSGPVETVRAQVRDRAAEGQAPVLHWGGGNEGRDAPVWEPRAAVDRQEGILTPVATLIAPFERSRQLVQPLPPDLRVIAWWLDGEPAAVARAGAGSHETWLGFALPEAGDAALRPAFRRFADWLDSPERAPSGMAPVAEEDLARFAEAPPQAEAATEAAGLRITPFAPWLALLAFLLAVAEPFLRRVLADRRAAEAQA